MTGAQRYPWWRIVFTVLVLASFLIIVFWGSSDIRWLLGALVMFTLTIADQLFNVWQAKQAPFRRSEYWQAIISDVLQLIAWVAILLVDPMANPYLNWGIGLLLLAALITLVGDIRLKRYII
ncbi:hypothetical protein [Schleiferilactobacillus harbinensis]|uniref:hypothetical protein n=1 Tax=Schleiferilactobacillus harbinensis TaxID=304207 RepID=UPI00345E2943